jgi:hypothetical protein
MFHDSSSYLILSYLILSYRPRFSFFLLPATAFLLRSFVTNITTISSFPLLFFFIPVRYIIYGNSSDPDPLVKFRFPEFLAGVCVCERGVRGVCVCVGLKGTSELCDDMLHGVLCCKRFLNFICPLPLPAFNRLNSPYVRYMPHRALQRLAAISERAHKHSDVLSLRGRESATERGRGQIAR